MIIWIASYPKSGNTWVKNIVNQIVHNDFKSNEDVFKDSYRIRRYPAKDDILDLPKIPDKYTELEKKSVIDHTIKNWKISQEKINLNNKINILKTHNMVCNINLDNKNYPFTDKENTTGVIHVVRDPRNIVASIGNHYSHDSQEKSVEMLLNQFNWIGFKDNDTPQLLSSWKNHYNSWKRFPNNNLLIKYEDLLYNTKNEISRLIKYLSKFFQLKTSDLEIDKIISNTSFENFKAQEMRGKFKENAVNEFGEKKLFFYLGPKNNWKKLLDNDLKNKLNDVFKQNLIELSYD